MREVQDHYFHKAKRDGYVARSAYKLLEIDDRKRVLKSGDWVLDCGAAPGSWMQVAASRVGEEGVVIGVDLKEIRYDFGSTHVRAFVGDLQQQSPEHLLHAALEAAGGSGQASRRFDVVLSDMAPNTSGDHTGDHHGSVRLCEAVLALCPALLRPDGRLVMKVFEGEAYMDLVRRTAGLFQQAKGYKPTASREESREMYIVATGFKGPLDGKGEQDPVEPGQAKPRPSAGWGAGRKPD